MASDTPTRQRRWYARNRGAQAAKYRENMKSDPNYRRKQHFKSRYGLTLEELDHLHAEQEGKCAACRDAIAIGNGSRDGAAHVDHCHEAGRVRGLLCNRCNQALGLLREDADRLAALLRYLTERC